MDAGSCGSACRPKGARKTGHQASTLWTAYRERGLPGRVKFLFEENFSFQRQGLLVGTMPDDEFTKLCMLPFSCVTQGKSSNFSEPKPLHLQKDKNITHLLWSWGGLNSSGGGLYTVGTPMEFFFLSPRNLASPIHRMLYAGRTQAHHSDHQALEGPPASDHSL